MGVLERNVEVRKDLAFSHQGNDFIDRRIRVHVVRAYPNAEFAEFLKQDLNVGLNGSAADEIQLVFQAAVSCAITSSSLTPLLTRLEASRITEPIGRETNGPLSEGIIQNVQ